MSNNSFGQLFTSINSVPLLVATSIIITGLTVCKCAPELIFEEKKNIKPLIFKENIKQQLKES